MSIVFLKKGISFKKIVWININMRFIRGENFKNKQMIVYLKLSVFK